MNKVGEKFDLDRRFFFVVFFAPEVWSNSPTGT